LALARSNFFFVKEGRSTLFIRANILKKDFFMTTKYKKTSQVDQEQGGLSTSEKTQVLVDYG